MLSKLKTDSIIKIITMTLSINTVLHVYGGGGGRGMSPFFNKTNRPLYADTSTHVVICHDHVRVI